MAAVICLRDDYDAGALTGGGEAFERRITADYGADYGDMIRIA